MITRKQAYKENKHRREVERTEIFPSMFNDLKLTFKRVVLENSDFNNHENKDVNDKSLYLVGYNGYWYMANAKRNYFNSGWEFNLGYLETQLGQIDFLFEIEGLEKYERYPLGWLDYDHDDEDLINENI